MKAIDKYTGKIIDIVKVSKLEVYPRIFQDVSGKCILEPYLEFLGEDQVVSGKYIARDENGDLYLYFLKPTRGDSGYWESPPGMKIIIPSNLFPFLNWTNEPKEVYINIILK